MLEPLHNIITTLSDFLYQPFIVPFLLVAAGLYLSIRMGFPQIRLFVETLRVLNEKPVQGSGISSFGALMVSTASRVGTGNIVGVSSAICMGGPGAVFWMWLIAVIGICGIDPCPNLQARRLSDRPFLRRSLLLHTNCLGTALARHHFLGVYLAHLSGRLQPSGLLQRADQFFGLRIL